MKAFVKHWVGIDFDSVYKGLILDITCSDKPGHTFSDGYDFAQTAICFLCGHYGKKLNDILGTDRRGKIVTVKLACVRAVGHCINNKLTGYRRLVNIDGLYGLEAPEKLETDYEADYAKIDGIIKMLGLTDRQREALLCRMSGMSYPEAARLLSIGTTTVFDIIAKIRQLYVRLFSEPKWRKRNAKL